MKYLIGLLAGSVWALMPAQAMPVHFTAMLSGANENPVVVTTGTGMADVWIDGVANTMRVMITFSDLLGTTTAAHIHCCAMPPTNAGVATQVPRFVGFPFGVSAGSYDQTFDMSALASYNPAFVTANGGTAAGAEAALFWGIRHDMAYVNVHSSLFPGGEIRGSLTPAPEPATLALLGAGLLGAFGARKRMKRS